MQCELQFISQELQYAMRRAGQNPTDVEVHFLFFIFQLFSISIFYFVSPTFCVQPLINKMNNIFFFLGDINIDIGSFVGPRYDQQFVGARYDQQSFVGARYDQQDFRSKI